MSGTTTVLPNRPMPGRPAPPIPPSKPQKSVPLLENEIKWKTQFFRERGWRSHSARNKALKASLDTAAAGLLRTGAPNGAAALASEKLEPGQEFKILRKLLADFETNPSSVIALSLAAAAANYIRHYGKLSSREQANKNTVRKIEACRKIAADIDLWIGVQGLGEPPWDSKTAMKAATIKAEFDFASLPGTRNAERLGDDVNNVNAAYWVNRKAAGSDKTDKTFLFKPAMERSDRVGIPKGGEPAREALTGRAADILNGMTGIDFKVPETHVVKVDRARFEAVLPDGVADRNGTGPLVGSLQQFAPSKGELRHNPPALMRAVPPERCQELAILDIVTMHMDRHGGNFMIDGDASGADLVPIDNGLSFPDSPDGLSYIAVAHNALLRLPGAHEPFSFEMQGKINQIEPDILKTALSSEVGDIEGVHPQAAGKIAPTALENARRAAMFLRQAAPRLTPALVQVALGQNAHRLFDTVALPDEAAFKAAAERIIDGIAHQEAELAEYFQLSLTEQTAIEDRCADLGWTTRHLSVTQLLKIFKSGAPAPARPSPGQDKQPPTEAEKAGMLAVFPQKSPPDIWFIDEIAAWRKLAALGDAKKIKSFVQDCAGRMSNPMYRANVLSSPGVALELVLAQRDASAARTATPAEAKAAVLDAKLKLIKQMAAMLPDPGRSQTIKRVDDLRVAEDAGGLDVERDAVAAAVRTLLMDQHRRLKESLDKLPDGHAKADKLYTLQEGKKYIDTDMNLVAAKEKFDQVAAP